MKKSRMAAFFLALWMMLFFFSWGIAADEDEIAFEGQAARSPLPEAPKYKISEYSGESRKGQSTDGTLPDTENPRRGKIYSAGSCRNEEKLVALTFDDGPHPTLTPEILSILREYGVPATFFVIGVNAEQYPELVEKEFGEGHEIASHTYSHGSMKSMSEEKLLSEMRKEAELLAPLCDGLPPKLFRPPGGVCTDCVRAAAAEMGYSLILWSIDTRDWAHRPTKEIVREVLGKARSGSIILMHDYISGGSPTPDALRQIIPALLQDGYRFVTVSGLLNTVA